MLTTAVPVFVKPKAIRSIWTVNKKSHVCANTGERERKERGKKKERERGRAQSVEVSQLHTSNKVGRNHLQ